MIDAQRLPAGVPPPVVALKSNVGGVTCKLGWLTVTVRSGLVAGSSELSAAVSVTEPAVPNDTVKVHDGEHGLVAGSVTAAPEPAESVTDPA